MVRIIFVNEKMKYISINENEDSFRNNIIAVMIKESEKNLSYTQFINRYFDNIKELITEKKTTFCEKIYSIAEHKENKYIEKKYVANKYKKLKLKKY